MITNVTNGLGKRRSPIEAAHLLKDPAAIHDQSIDENWKSFFPEGA
jgi:hypothetical protein